MIVGWAIDGTMECRLVVDALDMAIRLKATGNVFSYGVKRRDLQDAAIVEVGFYERPGR